MSSLGDYSIVALQNAKHEALEEIRRLRKAYGNLQEQMNANLHTQDTITQQIQDYDDTVAEIRRLDEAALNLKAKGPKTVDS